MPPPSMPPPFSTAEAGTSSAPQPKGQRTTAAPAASTATPAASTAIQEEISAEEAADIAKAIQQSLAHQEECEAPNLERDLVPENVDPFAFKDLLVSHLTEPFPRVDLGVPEEYNEDWEILKCLFIKWYYVFSWIPQNERTAVAVWRIFLFTYHNQVLIVKLRDLGLEGKVSLHRVPRFRMLDPPIRAGEVEEMRIKYEVLVASRIHGLTYEEHREEYQRLASSIYNLYGCAHLYQGQNIG